MNLTRSAALVGKLLGRMPGVLPTLHAATFGGLLAIGCTAGANAAVVASPVSNLAIPATLDGLYINVVSGISSASTASAPGWDINPWGTAGFYVWGTGAATSGAVLSVSGQVADLAPGTVVGASTPLFGNGQATTTAATSPWVLNSTDYFGFRFIGDDTFLHYGYGSVIVGSTLLQRTIGGLWYEGVANASITVPSATVVPESSNAAMLLAGGAALAAVVLRRRRQANA